MNVNVFLNIAPGLAQTVHENLAEFGGTKPLSLRMKTNFKK